MTSSSLQRPSTAGRQADRLRPVLEGLDLVAVDADSHEIAAALLHTARQPVLIAREPPYGAFGTSVLVAVDADPSCCWAAEVAASLAATAGGRVAIVAAPDHDAATRSVLAAAVERVQAILNTSPVVLDENAPPARAVAAAATAVEASLVVTGSRGPRSTGSVAEMIARAAPCSVLVMRAPRCG